MNGNHSAEAKAKIGDAQRKAWADPAKREARLAAMKAAREAKKAKAA